MSVIFSPVSSVDLQESADAAYHSFEVHFSAVKIGNGTRETMGLRKRPDYLLEIVNYNSAYACQLVNIP